MMRPCLTCGEPSPATYCTEHAPAPSPHAERRGSARKRGYDTAWDRLSTWARRCQPFCSDCGTTENLTTDHKPSAWARKAAGKSLRLRDVDVVCGPCNARRGSSRPGSERAERTRRGGLTTGGGTPPDEQGDPRGKAKSASHTPRGYR